ncbi:TRAP transporter small permease subunit [Meridianimarinicoccus marinus]|uniref:TRAP transporter small permease subunit n=1 Tax=Meridianimarinicoccus marinus TaxID=3231483 RepID=UPI00344DF7D2
MNQLVDVLNRGLLALCTGLFAVMFAGQVTIVLLRYVLGVGFLELQDAVSYAFACLVVLTIPLAMRAGRHVRVDVLRERMPPRWQAGVDRAGHLLLTLPVFALLLVNAWPLVAASWAIHEGSRETGGLAGLFLVKSTVVVLCLLVILIALADLVPLLRRRRAEHGS